LQAVRHDLVLKCTSVASEASFSTSFKGNPLESSNSPVLPISKRTDVTDESLLDPSEHVEVLIGNIDVLVPEGYGKMAPRR
jgi:hypothetical protein